MSAYVQELYEHFVAAMIAALQGSGSDLFTQVIEGIVEPHCTEKPFASVELLGYESTREQDGKSVKVVKLKLRVGYAPDELSLNAQAARSIGAVENFLDAYTPIAPADTFGFKDREWSVSNQSATVPGAWGFADCLVEAEIAVTRGDNIST